MVTASNVKHREKALAELKKELHMSSDQPEDDGYVVIFVTHFRHWRTGQIVRRADGKPFPLRVRERKRKREE